MLLVGGVIAALVLLIAFGIWQGNRPVDAPLPSGAATRYEDIATSNTSSGFPRLGEIDAPVQVQMLLSLDCAECRTFFEGLVDPLLTKVQEDEINLTLVPLYGYGTLTNATGGMRAALCANEQGAFWPYLEGLFNWQQFGSQAYTNARILSGADALGLDRGAFTACSLGSGPDGVLGTARSTARGLAGFSAPPAVLINNVLLVDDAGIPITDPALILEAVDRAAANLTASTRRTPTPEAESTAESTAEATSEATAEATDAPTLRVTPQVTLAAPSASPSAAEGTAEATPAP
jgi:protein-disulfide isomerase